MRSYKPTRAPIDRFKFSRRRWPTSTPSWCWQWPRVSCSSCRLSFARTTRLRAEKLRWSDKDPAMTNVLTMEREYGSGAAAIARNVAARLGWKLWDQLLTDEICRQGGGDRKHGERHEERRGPLHYRLFKAFLRGSFEGSLNEPRLRIADAESIRQLTEELVRAAAAEGNAVIVGRGSAYYLRDRPHAFHVFIYAPFEEKVRRLQLEERTQAEAVELAETVDRERSAFIKQHFGVEWPARHFFHLMINSTIGEDAAVRTIVDVLAGRQVGKTIAARGRAAEHSRWHAASIAGDGPRMPQLCSVPRRAGSSEVTQKSVTVPTMNQFQERETRRSW